MPKTYTHVTLEERAHMQVLLEHKNSLRTIARKLYRSPSTIAREFSRNHGHLPEVSSAPAPGRPAIAGGYRCARAHHRAQHPPMSDYLSPREIVDKPNRSDTP